MTSDLLVLLQSRHCGSPDPELESTPSLQSGDPEKAANFRGSRACGSMWTGDNDGMSRKIQLVLGRPSGSGCRDHACVWIDFASNCHDSSGASVSA